MKQADVDKRLFVPLCSGPYEWFRSGQKTWELRRYGRQFTEKHVIQGRKVELRRGYSSREDALNGVVCDVVRADGLRSFFGKVSYREVIPTADSEESAVRQAAEILRIPADGDTPLLGMHVVFEDRRDSSCHADELATSDGAVE